MFRALMLSPLLLLLSSFLLIASDVLPFVRAAPQNSTVDDQDFVRIDYERSSDWRHDPLIGWETDFNNHSRSYTYVPGATATFNFTGFAIWLQGPSAPDQAKRRIVLDGVDQGVYEWVAADRTPSAPFWGKTGLEYTTHTVVVSHADTADKIFALDAYIFTFDYSQSIIPYSTTTFTSTAPTFYPSGTPIPGATSGGGTGGTGGGSGVGGGPNTGTDSTGGVASNDGTLRSYSAIIIGIVVPVVFFLFLCICLFCIYRRRRTRAAQRRRESFREKFKRRFSLSNTGAGGGAGGGGATGAIHLANSPNSPVFGNRARMMDGSDVVLGALANRGSAHRRGVPSDDSSRPISPRTFASTHYSTAMDHDDVLRPYSPPTGIGPTSAAALGAAGAGAGLVGQRISEEQQRSTSTGGAQQHPFPRRNPSADLLDAHAVSAGPVVGAMGTPESDSASRSGASSFIGAAATGGGTTSTNANANATGFGARRSPATFEPPAAWQTTLASENDPHGQQGQGRQQGHQYHGGPSEVTGLAALAGAASGTAVASRRTGRGAGGNGNELSNAGARHPSTFFSDTTESTTSQSNYPSVRANNFPSVPVFPAGLSPSPNSPAAAGPSSPAPNSPTRSNSVLKRFSTALASSLPFARPSSKRDSGSQAMMGGRDDYAYADGQRRSDDDYLGGGAGGAAGAMGADNARSNAGGAPSSPSRGYFRGVNHFNLGIPLNYRPSATASPTTATTTPGTRARSQTGNSADALRASQNMNNNLGFEDLWLGSGAGGGNTPGVGGVTVTTPGTHSAHAGANPFDDFAFSSYTRQTRERVLSVHEANAAAAAGTAGTGTGAGATTTPRPEPLSRVESANDADDERDPAERGYGYGYGLAGGMEPEEKEEKIRENLDGETMQGEDDYEGRWSAGHGTLAVSPSSAGHATGGGSLSRGASLNRSASLARSASLNRQRSTRSTNDQNRTVVPPPYSVYVPPDSKRPEP